METKKTILSPPGQVKEGNPDEVDTQPIGDAMPECSPSPMHPMQPFIESQWRLERGTSTSNLGDRLEVDTTIDPCDDEVKRMKRRSLRRKCPLMMS